MNKRSLNLEIVAFAIAIAAIVLVVLVGKLLAGRPGPSGGAAAGAAAVTVTANERARRVDVTIGGAPFTSYIWPERLRKPVLYPIRGAKGTLVTRGWPLDPRPG